MFVPILVLLGKRSVVFLYEPDVRQGTQMVANYVFVLSVYHGDILLRTLLASFFMDDSWQYSFRSKLSNEGCFALRTCFFYREDTSKARQEIFPSGVCGSWSKKNCYTSVLLHIASQYLFEGVKPKSTGLKDGGNMKSERLVPSRTPFRRLGAASPHR